MSRSASNQIKTIARTGQHRDMLDQVLEALAIEPDVDLGLMEANQDLAAFASWTHSPDVFL